MLRELGQMPGIVDVALFERTAASPGVGPLRVRDAFPESAGEVGTTFEELAPILRQPAYGRWWEALRRGSTYIASSTEIAHDMRAVIGRADDYRILLLPVHCADEWWGFLWIGCDEAARDWTAGELGTLADVAFCLGKSIENRQFRSALEDMLGQQQALIEAGAAISGSLDPAIVLNRLAEQMVRATGVTSAYIIDWNGDTGEATVVADYYAVEASPRERVSDLGVTYNMADDFGDDVSWLYQGSVETVHVSDEMLNERERQHMIEYGACSILTVPFIAEDRIVGFAELWESRRERIFTTREIELCRGMARLGAMAFENVRLYDEIRQRANELELVHQVAVATATVVDIGRLLQETTKFIVERIYPDVFGFLLLDEESGEFRPHPSYHGLPPGGVETTVPIEMSVTGQVVRTRRPLIVPDVLHEPIYFAIVNETRSEIAVPMKSGERVIGVINVESRKRNAFTSSDLRFLNTLAGQVVTAIERARLYGNLENYAGQLANEVHRRTLELQSERDRTLAILESAGEGIMFTDVNATILYVNPAMERQTGYMREECLGNTPRLWKSDQTSGAVIAEMWKTLLNGDRWHGELVNKHKDGSPFDSALTITPLYGREGDLTGFVSVQADISRLKEVDRLKSKFVANVSHELRTPLTNIRTYLSLLERGEISRRERYMAVIEQEADRLTRLIQDLLDLSQLEERGNLSDMQPIDVGQLVRETTNAFSTEAARKQIAIDFSIDRPVPELFASRSELLQVLSNLLSNALAYTPAGGRVQVEAGSALRDGRPMVWFRVEDNGPGINPSEIPRLFDRFYRGEAAQRSGAPGTGLGLAISKEILEYYGATIELRSIPGQGASFTVWCPNTNEPAGVDT